jgi:hypothetical protein
VLLAFWENFQKLDKTIEQTLFLKVNKQKWINRQALNEFPEQIKESHNWVKIGLKYVSIWSLSWFHARLYESQAARTDVQWIRCWLMQTTTFLIKCKCAETPKSIQKLKLNLQNLTFLLSAQKPAKSRSFWIGVSHFLILLFSVTSMSHRNLAETPSIGSKYCW